jgi:predicted DNA-binding transcriptional regulator AlpA
MANLLHVEDVAALLGSSTRSVHELTRLRRIPCRRIAGTRRVLFVEEEVLAWVDAAGGMPLEVLEPNGGLVVRPAPAAGAASGASASSSRGRLGVGS